ncbi:MAG: pyridoxal-dependent decarboxylase [bacterium]|nr:pyridoxal-dependent decarboxylase [bacterium]
MKKIIKFFHTFIFLAIYACYDSRLRKGLVFGRAWSPLKFSARFFPFWFGKYNYNNILLHAKGVLNNEDIKISDSGTFNFTRYLEKKLLQNMVQIMKLPFSPFSGYITTGATEANIYAMWFAREWARAKIKELKSNKIYWIIPDNTHYSIKKALHLLDICNNSNNEVIIIKTDLLGRANYEEITGNIKKIRNYDSGPIILSLTVMTTECGSIDPVVEVDDFINRSKFNNIFFHIDAAFSGLFLPFLDEYSNIFLLQSLSSISIDFHKTIGGPVGSGSIIFRSGLEKHISSYVSYLSGNKDETLVGSRKGADAIAVYSILSVNSLSDIKKDILNTLEKTLFLAQEMSSINFIKLLYEPKLNYIVFYFLNIDKQKEKKMREVLKSYSITPSVVNIEDKKQELFKIIIRKDHTYKKIKTLISDLKLISLV